MIMDIPEDDELLRAMEGRYAFPGEYPVVVIARNDDAFTQRLRAAVAYIQDGAAFAITERPSSRASYISYHITLFVDSAAAAMERKRALRDVAGVLLIL